MISQPSLAELVRRHDRDRYQVCLFAPADRRDALLVLYAFNYEVARIRESVTQPMLGQIRLQWWREVIETAYGGGPARQHEVVAPLTEIIREHGLTRGHFERLIETREHDLLDEPPADMGALERYAEGTAGTLQWLALEILGTRDAHLGHAAGEIGIGYALTGLLRAMAFHARSNRLYLPADVTARTGMNREDYARLNATEPLRAAVRAIAVTAAAHLAAGKAKPAAGALPVLLPGTIARRYLRRLRAAGNDPFAPSLSTPDTLQSWRLLFAATTGWGV
ncbi:MAG: squalene/phytoene synthase family protein [Alphaproteobacteria bacterium]|nr:squalene/phytoene synthase family protein [Alphaproteobacteria bacterium]